MKLLGGNDSNKQAMFTTQFGKQVFVYKKLLKPALYSGLRDDTVTVGSPQLTVKTSHKSGAPDWTCCGFIMQSD
jgi:hypothetical protein